MPTSRLKITAQELKEMVNPTDDPKLFRFGNSNPNLMSEEKVDRLMEAEEVDILSAVPEHYRELAMGRVTGQYLTDRQMGAAGGETLLQLGLFPVLDGTVTLFKNFSRYGIPWRNRRREHAMAAGGFVINPATGVVTLHTPLAGGDVVLADYRHDAGQKLISLRSLVLKSARKELYVRFPNWTDSADIVTQMREDISDKLLQFIGDEDRGVAEIDDMQLLVESRQNLRDTIMVNQMRGGL